MNFPASQPEDERNGRSYNQRPFYQPPLKSYVIYDSDITFLPRDRPQISSTRPWHSEFNQRQQVQQPIETQSVYSNLIQIYDNPQRKYYGPHDGKAYLEPDRVYQNYPKPSAVPKYEVIYPYESQQTQYYNEKLPERFPRPFSPNKDFEIRDPPPAEYPRRDYGFYPTQTVHYDDSRVSRKDGCNYIRLNEKGFPVGNEMCGRSISDILLAPEYSTTGELVLEHRKRYRGVQQRQKRSAENEPRCCGDATGTGYGLYGSLDFGYDGRPYYYDEEDGYGQETSNNRGLTSYLTNRGRGGDEDDESNENESGRNQGDRSQSGGRRQNQNRNRSWQSSSRNNRRNGNGEDGYSSNRNSGNNYGYMRNNDDQSRYNNGRYDSFRNVGGGSFGYSPYSRYKK